MRTTLDLPENLLDEAMKTTLITTKTKVIITALEEVIRKTKISGLKKCKGKIDLDIDMDTVRVRKCRYWSIRLFGWTTSEVGTKSRSVIIIVMKI